jgi:hypothetical protein
MESTAAKQAREQSPNPAALSTSQRHTAPGSAPIVPSEKKSVGYGLPCSHCHAYYPADMRTCPICKSAERVSPLQAGVHSTASAPTAPHTGAPLDEERERLLKELKSQAFASHTQINAPATTQINAPVAFHCVLKHQHPGANEPAAVCHTCYSEARQNADRLEAALHMDAREAAKIVHTAVWADTSDPNVTYLNAAKALLSELQRRAGISPILGTHQSLAH